MSETATQAWWQAAFQAEYIDIYAHRDDSSAVAEVAGVWSMLRRKLGVDANASVNAATAPVLDACCGNGRHLEALRALGCDAYGFDWSSDLLAVAAQRAGNAGRIFRADMRCIPTAPSNHKATDGWAAICLFFTAFGYFDDSTNAAVLHGLAQRLRTGGIVMLDVPPSSLLTSTLPVANVKHISGGLDVAEDRCFTGKRVEKTVVVSRNDTVVRSYTESVRIYTSAEMHAMAADCGLRLYDTWASLRGADEDDGRAVYWFEKI